MRADCKTFLLWSCFVALATFVLVAGLPSHPRIFAVLNNFAHAPVFGALAVVNFQILTRHSPLSTRTVYPLSFLMTLAIGAGIELIQPMFGRDGETGDVITDALGAAAGLSFVALFRTGERLFPATVLVLAMAMAAWPVLEIALGYREKNRQFPALLEISSPFDWPFIWSHGFAADNATLPVAWRRPGDPISVRIRIERESWRVLSLFEPIPDWSSYSRLLIDLTNPEKSPLPLTLRIHDREHNNEKSDRFNQLISVPAETGCESKYLWRRWRCCLVDGE
jgi:hypothetical protein